MTKLLEEQKTTADFLTKLGIDFEIVDGRVTVGGYLDLSRLTSIPEGFNPTVGGNLYLSGRILHKTKKYSQSFLDNIHKLKLDLVLKVEAKLTWQNGKYRKIDGVFCEVIKQWGNILKAKVSNKKVFIFQKDGISAHGKTVKQAYRDWLFKTSDRDVSKYENIKPDDVYNLDFWIIAYRTITGACSFGTNNYLENNKDKYKDEMTLKEVFKATEGQYGSNTFKEFFSRA